MPQTFQTLDEVSLQTVCVESIEITTAQVGIGVAPLLKVVSNHQDAVGDGNDGALRLRRAASLLNWDDRYVFFVRAAAHAD